MREYSTDTYRISDRENGITVAVAPEFGGMLTEFNVQGKDILYLRPELLEKRSIHAGGFPLLFPICGTLKNDSYSVGEKTYSMPSHGFAKGKVWEADRDKLTESSITLTLASDDETLVQYPFEFKLKLTYELNNGVLIVRQEVVNLSERQMPYFTGYHPFFSVSGKEALKFEINADNYINCNTGTLSEYDGKVDFSKPVDHVFYDLNGSRHSYTSAGDGYRLEMELDESFKNIVLWTEKGKPFICMEPWMSDPDALNTGRNLRRVAPGDRDVCEIRIKVRLI